MMESTNLSYYTASSGKLRIRTVDADIKPQSEWNPSFNFIPRYFKCKSTPGLLLNTMKSAVLCCNKKNIIVKKFRHDHDKI